MSIKWGAGLLLIFPALSARIHMSVNEFLTNRSDTPDCCKRFYETLENCPCSEASKHMTHMMGYCSRSSLDGNASRIASALRTDLCISCEPSEVDHYCRVIDNANEVAVLMDKPDKPKATLSECKDAAITYLTDLGRDQPELISQLCDSVETYMDPMLKGEGQWLTGSIKKSLMAMMRSGATGWQKMAGTDWQSCVACISPSQCNIVTMACETYYTACAEHGARAPGAGPGGIGSMFGVRKSRPKWSKLINNATYTCRAQTWAK